MWLVRAYPHGFGSFYPTYDLDETTLAAAGLADRRLRALSTHNIRRFPPISCGRRMRYFTVLRDPLEQYLSYVHYMQQVQGEIADPAFLERLPPNCAALTSREFTAWLLDRPHLFAALDNAQTNFLAEYTWRERAGDPSDAEAYRRERLALALEIVDGFAMVGTVERLPESLALLRRRAAAWGFTLLPPDEIGRENVTLTPRDGTAWIGEHDEVGARLLAAMADDRALHAYAQRALDAANA